MVLLFATLVMFTDPMEVRFTVNNNDGVKQAVQVAEFVWDDSQGGDGEHMAFRSFDESFSGDQVVLTVRIDSQGEHLFAYPRGRGQVTHWLWDVIGNYNNGNLVAHSAVIKTEWIEEQGQNRTKSVVFTVPLLPGDGSDQK